ncbi:MAG TPA: MMPL family transporter [Solirubrobacteraceae bacterium]|nr:MMPL family transporter [Solirubrobacteraceae bacterium]
MIRWTGFVIAHRKRIVAVWLVLFALGAYAAANLGGLLSNRFSVPGAESERGLELIEKRMGDRSDGAFTLVATGVDTPAERAAVVAAARRAAGAIERGKPGPLLSAAPGVVYAQIATPLDNQDASNATPALRRAIGEPPGVTTYLSGYPAINHDTQKIFNEDLGRGESIGVPIALLVMAAMFGTLGGMFVPVVFAAVTIPTTLGLVWIFAHTMEMAIYVTNVVALIGLAIAVDYSMLVVFRYREELRKTADPHAALRTTMATAGRATLFSGITVAIGLALLVFMPLPFMRSMGVGGLLVPVVSIVASATLLPAMLAMMGRGVNRFRFIPRRVLERRADADVTGGWHRLATAIMRRPVLFFAAAAALMIALAVPATGLQLTGGDNRGMPLTTESTRGLRVLETTLGPGALAPHQIVVDTHRAGGAGQPRIVAAQRALAAQLRRDPAIQARTIAAPAFVSPARARQANLVDPDGRVLQVRAAGRTDAGTKEAMDLVDRLRDRYVPAAGFPPGTEVLVSGAPAFGVDFIDKAYGAFPWLVLAVLAISYLILLRAFRSVVLPAKAVVMNLLSVGATYGVLVLAFQHGWGEGLGLGQSPQIEAWIPIFLFALLFGLSMDYEVFLLSRIREEWDRRHDNEQAVAYGLEHTGRIITAAAIIMLAAFAGFVFGSFVGLQEFGLGLSAAILLDATIVRAILVPATMKLLGRWNWYLPERVRRALRVRAPHVATDDPAAAGAPVSR